MVMTIKSGACNHFYNNSNSCLTIRFGVYSRFWNILHPYLLKKKSGDNKQQNDLTSSKPYA